MFRILHVGLGPLGRMIAADLHARRLGDVVAAVDAAPDLAGKKLADLVPGAKSRVTVRGSLDELRDWRSIDCAIVTTTSDLERCSMLLREILGRGVPAITTCEELVFPWPRHEALARELDQHARDNRVQLLGTGVNPGFLMDAFPLVATTVSRSVRRVEVHRLQDASIRRVPFQQKIGVGLDEAEFAVRLEAGTIRHVGLLESVHFLASSLGLPIDRAEEEIGPVRADRDLDSALGPVAAGRVSGVRQVAVGRRGEEVLVRLEFVAAVGLGDPHDRVIVEGEPPIDLVWRGGVPGDVATSAIVLNCLGPLLASPPGLHTMATIPLAGCASRSPEPIRRPARRRSAAAPPKV